MATKQVTTKKDTTKGSKKKQAAHGEPPGDYYARKRAQVTGKYQPTQFTERELATLGEIGMRGGNPRADVAHAEVARIARNIAVTLSDPETPAEVREAVRKYALDVCHWTLQDFAYRPAAVMALFPVACVGISEVPFVPSKERIEALTGTNRQAALAVARMKED